MFRLSVIIPIFNAEKYLERCLDSVCNQSLKEIEIICVNDFSDDGSLQILQKYSEKFSNLKIINLEKNLGESGARNAGILAARGEYLGFVDNDDFVDLNFYEKLYNKACESSVDIVKGQVVEIEYNGKKHFIEREKEGENKFFFITYWWSAIYKRSLILENNISFLEKFPLGADLLFLNKAVNAAKNLQVVKEVYYHYCRREDSGDSKILSDEKIQSALTIYEMIIAQTNKNITVENAAYNFVFHNFLMACFYISLKTSAEKMKLICAKTIINIFAQSLDQRGLQSYFLTTSPHLYLLLKNQNHRAIEEMLLKCKSRMELLAQGLRARLQKNN